MPEFHQRVLDAYRHLELQFAELTNHHARAKLAKLVQLVPDKGKLKALIDTIPDAQVRELIRSDVQRRLDES